MVFLVLWLLLVSCFLIENFLKVSSIWSSGTSLLKASNCFPPFGWLIIYSFFILRYQALFVSGMCFDFVFVFQYSLHKAFSQYQVQSSNQDFFAYNFKLFSNIFSACSSDNFATLMLTTVALRYNKLYLTYFFLFWFLKVPLWYSSVILLF